MFFCKMSGGQAEGGKDGFMSGPTYKGTGFLSEKSVDPQMKKLIRCRHASPSFQSPSRASARLLSLHLMSAYGAYPAGSASPRLFYSLRSVASRVVDRQFIFGPQKKEQFVEFMRL